MPSHHVHAYMDRIYFGKAYWKVHRKMDSAYQYLRGKHRILWHDPISACAIAADNYPNDENAVYSALNHIQVDDICSSNPLFHRQLSLMAKLDAEKRQRSRRQRTKRRKKPVPQSSSILEETESFLKKLAKLKKTQRTLVLWRKPSRDS